MFLLFLLFVPVVPQDISPFLDAKTLTELSLEKLLQVQNSFKEQPQKVESPVDEAPEGPEALALQAKRKPNERGGYHYYDEEHSKKNGKKSIQSIFQVSVTALAFLAFGGYLLCLLVQAIKGKTMTTMVVETTTAATLAAFLGARPARRRPTRRPERFQRPLPRRPKRDVWPDTDPDDMYHALVHLSEAYTQYHTIDYKNLNFTAKSYVN